MGENTSPTKGHGQEVLFGVSLRLGFYHDSETERKGGKFYFFSSYIFNEHELNRAVDFDNAQVPAEE
jgi:hypothetical protein